MKGLDDVAPSSERITVMRKLQDQAKAMTREKPLCEPPAEMTERRRIERVLDRMLFTAMLWLRSNGTFGTCTGEEVVLCSASRCGCVDTTSTSRMVGACVPDPEALTSRLTSGAPSSKTTN